MEELKVIASSPSHLYMDSSVTADQLANAICRGEISTAPPPSLSLIFLYRDVNAYSKF